MIHTTRTLRWLALILFLVGALGCMNMRYVRSKAVPAPEPPASSWNHFFFWGLAGDPEIDLTESCPDGVARVEVYHSFGNQLVGFFTLGLYSPTTTEVWCARAERTVHEPPAPPSLAQFAPWGSP